MAKFLEVSELVVGKVYYMLQSENLTSTPEITTFAYHGLTDDGAMHFFEAKGMSETNLLLKSIEVRNLMDFYRLQQYLVNIDYRELK